MTDMTVANTIWQQLKAGGVIKLMSWGVETKKLVGDVDSLTFRVHARRHKGFVKVTLNSMDLYDVQLITFGGELKKEINGLYFDQLTEVIDSEIEDVSQYKR